MTTSNGKHDGRTSFVWHRGQADNLQKLVAKLEPRILDTLVNVEGSLCCVVNGDPVGVGLAEMGAIVNRELRRSVAVYNGPKLTITCESPFQQLARSSIQAVNRPTGI